MRLERNSKTGNAMAKVAATWLSRNRTLGRRRVIVAWSSRAHKVSEETHICELLPTRPASNVHTRECCKRETEIERETRKKKLQVASSSGPSQFISLLFGIELTLSQKDRLISCRFTCMYLGNKLYVHTYT